MGTTRPTLAAASALLVTSLVLLLASVAWALHYDGTIKSVSAGPTFFLTITLDDGTVESFIVWEADADFLATKVGNAIHVEDYPADHDLRGEGDWYQVTP